MASCSFAKAWFYTICSIVLLTIGGSFAMALEISTQNYMQSGQDAIAASRRSLGAFSPNLSNFHLRSGFPLTVGKNAMKKQVNLEHERHWRSRAISLDGVRGLQSKGPSKESKKPKKLAFDLADQMRKNQALHELECGAMMENFDAKLGEGKVRTIYDYDDFKHIEFAKDLIGDNVNAPFKSEALVHYSKKPVFTTEECDTVIAEAEGYAKARGGWATQRHYSHPTTDIMLKELPESLAWFKEIMPTKLFPMIASCFPSVVKDPELLRIFDVFVVKYDAFEQSYLSVHRDSSLISVTVALNSKEDFDGGGMWLEPLNKVVELDQGDVVTFASNVRHGGNKVTGGLRYILVGFLLYEGYCEHDRRLLEASQASRSAGNMQLAEKLCREALAANGQRQEAWNNLGCLQRDSGDFKGSMDSFKRCLEIEDTYQEGWVNMGVCQGLSGDASGAMETALHAVSMNDRDATSHYNLGCSYSQMGDDSEARKEFDKVIVLNSRDGDAFHRRGELSMKEGDMVSAISDLERAADLLPKSCNVQNDLGVARYENDDCEGALEAFGRALRIDPTNQQAQENAVALKTYLDGG